MNAKLNEIGREQKCLEDGINLTEKALGRSWDLSWHLRKDGEAKQKKED